MKRQNNDTTLGLEDVGRWMFFWTLFWVAMFDDCPRLTLSGASCVSKLERRPQKNDPAKNSIPERGEFAPKQVFEIHDFH